MLSTTDTESPEADTSLYFHVCFLALDSVLLHAGTVLCRLAVLNTTSK